MSSKRNEELATAILKNKPKPNRLIVDQSPKDDTSIVPVDKGDTFTVNAAMRSVEFKIIAARQRSAATAHRQKTATARRLSTLQLTELNEQSPSEQYREVLREMQMPSGCSTMLESRCTGLTSNRNKRITKERASMHNSLNDTPYENGLFEFDMFFPSNYPQQPPKCSFLTTGAGKVRFNSNLYTDGTICLSILGTWEGRPEEKWNPLCVFKRIATRKQLIALTELRARRAHQALLQTFASAQFTN
uniref:UBIQUITIN_CONJUGAT_2 domain-containing protein n=1 Tax=Globodera pallida TaxID=36090 RepID=A0A183CAN5_GLOPA